MAEEFQRRVDLARTLAQRTRMLIARLDRRLETVRESARRVSATGSS